MERPSSAAGESDPTQVAPTLVVGADAAETVVGPAPPGPVLAPSADAGPRAIGDYEILGELGRGGMGVVYRARQKGLEREVALKVLAGPGLGESARRRFEREARAASRLHHPGIVAIHELHLETDVCYYSMERIEGRSLAERLREHPEPLPPREAAALVRRVAEATGYAHLNGIVHRDLKPANVLLRPDGSPAVADFGLARSLDDAVLTGSGERVGTPAYMSPEQAAGTEVGPASDVYALGTLLYECLTLRTPHSADTVAGLLHRIVHEDPAPVRRLRPAVPVDLATICEKAMRREPRDRYAGAGALAEDLRRFLEHEPIRARRLGPIGRLRLRVRRHPGVAAGAAATLLIASLGAYAGVEALRARRTVRAEHARGLEKGSLEERAKWVEADRLVQAATARLEAALAWRRGGRPGRLPDAAGEIDGWLDRALAIYPEFPLAHVVRARLRRALGDDDAALRLLDRAIELEPELGIAYYDRGLIRVEAFHAWLDRAIEEDQRRRLGFSHLLSYDVGRRRLAESIAHLLAGPDETPRRLARLAAEDFARVGSSGLHPDKEACGRGLLALYSGDLDGAGLELGRAVELHPSMAETWRAIAELALRRDDVPAAVDAYRRAIEADAGRWQLHWSLGNALLDLTSSRNPLAPSSAQGLHDEVEERLERALALLSAMPRRSAGLEARVLRSRLAARYNRALFVQRQGGDAVSIMAEARPTADRLVELAPVDPWSHFARGRLLSGTFHVQWWAGRDALPAADEAVESFRRALELDPDAPEFHGGLGHALLDRVESLATRDEPYGDALDECLAHLDRAIEGLPEEADYRLRRATAILYRIPGSDSPEAWIDRADEDLRVAARLVPESTVVLVQTATHLYERAVATTARGGDAREGFRRSIEALDRVLALPDAPPLSLQQRGRAAMGLAQALEAAGEDPHAAVERAISDHERLTVLLPGHPFGWVDLALARQSQAILVRRIGGDPGPGLEEALRTVERAIGIVDATKARRLRLQLLRQIGSLSADPARRLEASRQAVAQARDLLDRSAEGPERATSTRSHAECLGELAFQVHLGRSDPTTEYEASFAEFERALSLAPADDDVVRAYLQHLSAGTLSRRIAGARRRAWAERGLDLLRPLLRHHPRDRDAHEVHGELAFQIAQLDRDEGRPALAAWDEAVAAYDLVLELAPGDATIRLWRGLALDLSTWDELQAGGDPERRLAAALEDYDAALAAEPGQVFVHGRRGLVGVHLSAIRSARGDDARALLEVAGSDLSTAAAASPEDPDFARGLLVVAARLERWAAAADRARRLAKVSPAEATWALWLARGFDALPSQHALGDRAWAADLVAGDRAIVKNRLRAAVERYEAGLAHLAALPDAEREEALASETARAFLARVHLNLAGLLAQFSAGQEAAGLPPVPVGGPERRRLADAALAHLESAIALEQTDPATIEAFPDLAPLRGEARYRRIVGALARER